MERDIRETQSIWQDTDFHFTSPMISHQSADICVIGAGISGLTTAYNLLLEDRTVVVLERDILGSGQTGRTSAHLSNALDDRYHYLKKVHGTEGAKKAAESHTAAINQIEEIIRREQIDCDFQRVNGYLFLSPEQGIDSLIEELDACHESGLKNVELLQTASTRLFSSGPCLQFPNQARFHPLRYIRGLAKAVTKMGGKIFTRTEAQEVEGGRPARVTTNRGFQVVCDSVVVATNVPFNDRVTVFTKEFAYRSYMIAIQIPKEISDPSLFWDTGDPYHYIRSVKYPSQEYDLLLVGGEDHRTGHHLDEEARYGRLEQWVKDRLNLKGSVVSRWSGQVEEPYDGLAFIGRNPGDEDNVYIATGDSGHGLTHGTIAGILLKDLILGRPNSWEQLYNPSRMRIRGLKSFIRENTHTAVHYSEWFSRGDVNSLHEIRSGEGAVVREGLQKMAVYKDSRGKPHFYSAVCPHLGGIVHWNNAEKTWDCPCHGSRFDKHGNVINGPSSKGLRCLIDPTLAEPESASA